MIHRIAHQLELKKKLLLAVAGTAAIVLPVLFGVLRPVKSLAQSPAGQVESVYVERNKNGTTMSSFPPIPHSVFLKFTPDSFQATNATLTLLIGQAYGVEMFQVSGGPSWINAENLHVNVKFNSPEGADRVKLMDQRRLWLQSLLARLFKLEIHRETRLAPIYELVPGANGPKFHEATPGDIYANGPKSPLDGKILGVGIWNLGQGEFVGQGVSMPAFAGFLSRLMGRQVVDKTGLVGNYDFTLSVTPVRVNPSEAIRGALPQELGLQLNPQIGPVEMIIIDHAEQSSGNQ
jgi:bla regulator protein blaR1